MPLVKYRIYELSARAVISYGRQQDGTYTFHLSAAEGGRRVAIIDAATQTASDLLRCADARLYRAKQTGRNRACAID